MSPSSYHYSQTRENIQTQILTTSLSQSHPNSSKRQTQLTPLDLEKLSEADGIVPLSKSKTLEKVDPEKQKFHFTDKELYLKDFEPPEQIISMNSNKTMDFFFYHCHEEDNNIYLFGKNYSPNAFNTTLCIQILRPCYYLYFYPIFGREDELIEEVRDMCVNNNGFMINAEYKTMKYCWGDQLIQTEAKWLEVSVSNQTDLKRFPQKGRSYTCVSGISSSLTENFLIRRKIKGPQWCVLKDIIEPQNVVSFCPMYCIKTFDDVVVNEDKIDSLPPPLNVCILTIRSFFDETARQHQIFALSLRVFMNCSHLEDFESNYVHTYITKPSSWSSEMQICPDADTEKITVCQSERQLLTRFVSVIEALDVDFLASFSMFTTDIPLLFERMRVTKVKQWSKISRLNRDTQIRNNRVNKILCFAGRFAVDIREGCGEFLKLKANDLSSIALQELQIKRQQIDHLNVSDELEDKTRLHNLVVYMEKDTAILTKLIEKIQLLQVCFRLSQVSGCQLARILTCRPSIRCEYYLLHSFYERDYILPDKSWNDKNFMKKKEPKYRGGTVLQPKKGFYDSCICLLDFNSLYPSVICEYNLCFTTISRQNPTAEEAAEKPFRGVMPVIMDILITKRNEIKKEIETQEMTQLAKSRLLIKQQAIKSLSNSIYGHIGQNGSRFQCTELAALVTERGRYVLQETVETIESTGRFSVIYGDTDSVMIDTGAYDIYESMRIADEIKEEIQHKYNYLKLKVDGIFTKMLLVAKKKYAVMVYNQSNNTQHQEVKGLDMVRRDWCALTKYISSFILDQMMNETRENCIQNVLNELEHITFMLHHNGSPESQDSGQLTQITKEMLIIYRQLNKNLNEYSDKRQNPHVAIAIRMKQRGEPLPPHATIPMIVTSPQLRDLCDKVKLPDEVKDLNDCDINWYLLNQIMPPICRLFEPYGGVSNATIAKSLGLTAMEQSKYSNDNEFSLLQNIPHVTELMYKCSKCGEQIIVTRNYQSSMRCQKCGRGHNWKPVANQLVLFIRNFINTQRNAYTCPAKNCEFKTTQNGSTCPVHNLNVSCQSAKDVHSTLRYFAGLFQERKIINEDDEDFEDFRAYMQNIILKFLDSHAYNHVNLSSLIV